MLDVSPERGWVAILADAEAEARTLLLQRSCRLAVCSAAVSTVYAFIAWLMSDNTPWYNALIAGSLFAITQTTAWWRFVSSKRRMKLGMYGTWPSEAELIGDIIAKAQREAGTPGPSSDIARLGRQERLRELYEPPPRTEATA